MKRLYQPTPEKRTVWFLQNYSRISISCSRIHSMAWICIIKKKQDLLFSNFLKIDLISSIRSRFIALIRCVKYVERPTNTLWSYGCSWWPLWNEITSIRPNCTGYTQKNDAVSKVNKKFISHLTRAQRTPSAAATVHVSHELPTVRFSCLLRSQFPTWRRSRKRLPVCSVLRCPDLWLQCTKLTLHCNHRSGHLKTEHTESLFLLRRRLENWPRSKHEKRTAGSAWET